MEQAEPLTEEYEDHVDTVKNVEDYCILIDCDYRY